MIFGYTFAFIKSDLVGKQLAFMWLLVMVTSFTLSEQTLGTVEETLTLLNIRILK